MDIWSMKRKKCQNWHGLWIQQECIHTHTWFVHVSPLIPTTTSAHECVQGAELKLIAEGWRSLWSISWRSSCSSPGAPLAMLPSCGKVSFLGSPWFNDLISDPSLVTPAVSGTHWWHLTPWHRHWWANCSSPGTTNSLWLRSSQMIYGLKWIRDSVIHPMFSFTLNHMYIMPYSQESFCFVSTCGQETTSAWTPLVNNFSRIVSASNAIPLFPHTFLKPQGAESIWWHSNGHEFWVPSLLLTREEPQSYCSHRYPRKLRISVFPFKHYEPPHSHHLLYRVYSNI